MNNNIKDLISFLKMYGERETNSFTKFFFFYMCFDAWITAESGEEQDKKKLFWFINNDSCLKRARSGFWNSSETRSWLNNLKSLSPVMDMRPNHQNRFVELKDIDNLNEVILFIYQIRCNLFHGAKNPADSRDRSVVGLSAILLEKWIKWATCNCL